MPDLLIQALKYIAIFFAICVLWFILVVFSPIHFTSQLFNLAIIVLAPGLATLVSVVFAYWQAPGKKFFTSIAAFIVSVFISYPVYGPGYGVTVMLNLQEYSSLPMISVFVAGLCAIYLCYKFRFGVRS